MKFPALKDRPLAERELSRYADLLKVPDGPGVQIGSEELPASSRSRAGMDAAEINRALDEARLNGEARGSGASPLRDPAPARVIVPPSRPRRRTSAGSSPGLREQAMQDGKWTSAEASRASRVSLDALKIEGTGWCRAAPARADGRRGAATDSRGDIRGIPSASRWLGLAGDRRVRRRALDRG